MKRLFLVFIVVALTLPQAGQAGWWRTYGETGYEVGNCVQITSDGNYIISGAKDLHLWVLKVDTTGKIIWEHIYGPSDTKLWRWIEETDDGGFIIAPRTPSLLKINSLGDSVWAKDYGIQSHCVQQTKDGGYIFTGDFAELRLVKTNSEGDTIWTHRFSEPGNNYNVGYFIQTTDDGGYIIIGSTEYSDEYVNWSNLWLIKTDSLGNKMWSKVYGDSTIAKGYCVRQTLDGGYILTGLNPKGLWLLKTDSKGDSLWSKVYGNPIAGEGYSVQRTDDNGFIITGTSSAAILYSEESPRLRDLCLLKTDENGDTLWTRMYGGGNESGGEIGYCVQQTSEKGYIIVGYTTSYGSGGSDIYLLKTDSLGLLGIADNPIVEADNGWNVPHSIGHYVVLRYQGLPQGFRANVFDVSGRKVDQIRGDGIEGAMTWGINYPPGVYFIQATCNSRDENGSNLKIVKVEIIR